MIYRILFLGWLIVGFSTVTADTQYEYIYKSVELSEAIESGLIPKLTSRETESGLTEFRVETPKKFLGKHVSFVSAELYNEQENVASLMLREQWEEGSRGHRVNINPKVIKKILLRVWCPEEPVITIYEVSVNVSAL